MDTEKQKFVILITASPQNTQSHLTAIKYLEAIHAMGETITCVFFYHEAVLVANQFNLPPSDEPQLLSAWEKLAAKTDVELMTCVSASFRRGIIDNEEANTRQLVQYNLSDSFNIVGLGQLSSALSLENSKLVHFK